MIKIITGIIQIAEEDFTKANDVLHEYDNVVTKYGLGGVGEIVVDHIDPEAFDELHKLGIISDGDFNELPELDVVKIIVE